MKHNLLAKAAVLERQVAWADAIGKVIDHQCYLDSIETNLFQPLSASALNGFRQGSGSELLDRGTHPAKIKALHSSAALALNVFDYWTTRDSGPLAAAMGISSSISGIEFEKKFFTGLGGNPPNLDIVLCLEAGAVIAIESKFTEWMTAKSPSKTVFRPAYFPQSRGIWARLGMNRCQQLAEAVAADREQFRWLDVPQLLKHALGLGRSVSGNFSLHYVFFDVPSSEGTAHQEEIDRFSEAVGREMDFVAHSYQVLFRELVTYCGAKHAGYVNYLDRRYFQ